VPPVTIQFDWTITVGTLLTGATVVASVVTAIVRYYKKLDTCIHRIERKTDEMHQENKISIAVIEARVTDMWQWFNDR